MTNNVSGSLSPKGTYPLKNESTNNSDSILQQIVTTTLKDTPEPTDYSLQATNLSVITRRGSNTSSTVIETPSSIPFTTSSSTNCTSFTFSPSPSPLSPPKSLSNIDGKASTTLPPITDTEEEVSLVDETANWLEPIFTRQNRNVSKNEIKSLAQFICDYDENNSIINEKKFNGEITGITRNILKINGMLLYHFNKASDGKDKGATGKVSDAIDLLTGEIYKIKSCPEIGQENSDHQQDYQNEYELQEIFYNNSRFTHTFGYLSTTGKDNRKKSYLVLEKMAGTLPPSKNLTLDQKNKYAKDIVTAVKDLHEQDIVHRDLKPGNILISSDGIACLSDFGFSCEITDASRIQQFGGTGRYLSPQNCAQPGPGIRSFQKSDDVWALGILLYEHYEGSHPFKNQLSGTNGIFAVAKAIRSLNETDLQAIPFSSQTPKEVQEAIRGCLTIQENKRATIQEIEALIGSIQTKNSSQ